MEYLPYYGTLLKNGRLVSIEVKEKSLYPMIDQTMKSLGYTATYEERKGFYCGPVTRHLVHTDLRVARYEERQGPIAGILDPAGIPIGDRALIRIPKPESKPELDLSVPW
jgi:hypothetical protein